MRPTITDGLTPGRTGLDRQTEKVVLQMHGALQAFGERKIEVKTSDATAKTAWSDDMPANTTWRVEYLIIGQDASGNIARYHEAQLVKRTSGSPTIAATTAIEAAYEDVGAWAFTFTAAASGTLSLSVTGAAATEITWLVWVSVAELRR